MVTEAKIKNPIVGKENYWEFLKYLVQKGYLEKEDGKIEFPYQRWMDEGLFEFRTTYHDYAWAVEFDEYDEVFDAGTVEHRLIITPKGRSHLLREFDKTINFFMRD